jgi:hypothetical protein
MTALPDPAHRRWEEIDHLFAEALELPADARRAHVETAAAGDQALIDALLDLLAAEALSEGRWEAPGRALARECLECRMARALVARGRPAEAAPHFARAIPSLVATTSVPEYRRECLETASAYYAARGDAAESARLDAALRNPPR